jgi:hypothetical protein
MPSLPALLRRYERLTRAHAALGGAIAGARRAILAAARAPRPRKGRAHRTAVAEAVQAAVKVLCDAGMPLPRREVAARLGCTPADAGAYLRRAIGLGFVEKTGPHYTCTAAARAALC